MSDCDKLEEMLLKQEAYVLGLERDYRDAAGEPGLREELARDLEREAQALEDGYVELADCRAGFRPELLDLL